MNISKSNSIRIDGEKAIDYFKKTEMSTKDLSEKVGVSDSYFRRACKVGYTNRIYWNAICDVLGVPRDFFNYKEPVIDEKEEKTECMVDLADIQYSLNIHEKLLTQILEALVELREELR